MQRKVKVTLLSLEDNRAGLYEYFKKASFAFSPIKGLHIVNLAPASNYRSSFLKILVKAAKYWVLSVLNLRYFNKHLAVLGFSDLILITDYPLYLPYFAKFLSISLKAQIYLTIHDLEPHLERSLRGRIVNQLIRRNNRELLTLASRENNINVVLHDTRHLSKYEYNRKYLVVNYHPLPRPLPHQEDVFGLSNKTNVTFLGRLEYYKGCDVFLEAIDILNNDNLPSNLQFVIAGNGHFNFQTRDNTNILKVNRFLTSEEYNSILYHSQVLVFPYRDASQSGVLIDAKVNDKIVIINDAGTLKEYIEDSDYILQELTPSQLAECIKQAVAKTTSNSTIKTDYGRKYDNYANTIISHYHDKKCYSKHREKKNEGF